MTNSGPPNTLHMDHGPAGRTVYLAWAITALASAVFCIVAALAMLSRDVQWRDKTPLNAPALTALKLELTKSPNDESIKQKIRELDLEIRSGYFTLVRFKRTGAWLIVLGMAIFLYSAKKAVEMRKQQPLPGPPRDPVETLLITSGRARVLTGSLTVVAMLGMLGLALSHRGRVPTTAVELEKLLAGDNTQKSDSPTEFASAGEYFSNWPRFLGPTGNAFTTNMCLPESVDPTNGVGICWQTTLDAPGFSSPIVWRERVFLTGGDANQRVVLCYNAASGELMWRQTVQNLAFNAGVEQEAFEGAGPAAASPATDGRHVYAIFGNGDLIAFKFDGSTAWSKNIGVPDNPYGHAQSLLVLGDKLIVPMDQSEAEKNRSKLLMLDGGTGKVLWEKTRSVPSSWATPIVIGVGASMQIVTLGGEWVISYDASSGAELWRVQCLAGEITPSPIFVAGHVLAISPNDRIVAIRPDGRGDVTKTHLAWVYEDNVPDIASPVGTDELVFMVSTPGVLTCLNAKTGAKLWEHDFEFEVNATPAIATSCVIVCGKKGHVVVVEAGPEFKELTRFKLNGEIYASPAFAGGRMFVRTTTTLYCIGAAAKSDQ